VLVERSLHPEFLSNAYLVADEEGGAAVFVDSGADMKPLLQAAGRWRVEPSYVLRTHSHHDHVVHEAELGLPVRMDAVEVGGLHVEALPTPGHSDDMVAFVVNGEAVFTGDTLFKDSVGGGDFEQVRGSVIDVLMKLPPGTRVLPGHTDETTIGREWEENPFVRVWRGEQAEGTEHVRVGGEDATLIVWSPDYDGSGKAWVRFGDGRDAIVGGSRVERG
jgi:glyoxylase-like metal-dependent hydrolase (beta-lactamase superfamily II)